MMNEPRTDQKKQNRFMLLFEPHQDRLERYCMALSRDREEARDLVSEVVLQSFSNLSKLRDEDKFPNYLFSIAKKMYLKKKRRNWVFKPIDEPSIMITDLTPDAARQLDYKILYAALNKLPDKLKQAVVLHELTGFPLKEVAEMEKCSLSAAKVRVMRGRKKLAKLLTEEPLSSNDKTIHQEILINQQLG